MSSHVLKKKREVDKTRAKALIIHGDASMAT